MSVRTSTRYSSSSDDPISFALRVRSIYPSFRISHSHCPSQPPPQETDAQRTARLEREAEARRISERIDEGIRQDRERFKKSKGDVKARPVDPFRMLLLTHLPAPSSRPGRIWQEHSSEAVPIDVQAQIPRR